MIEIHNLQHCETKLQRKETTNISLKGTYHTDSKREKRQDKDRKLAASYTPGLPIQNNQQNHS